MSDKLKEYEKEFKSYIVESCKNYNHGLYDEKDLKHFENLAQNEYDYQLESVDTDDLDYENPQADAKECMSYWDY